MKRYLDIEHDKIYTIEELQKQYEELKANGETEEETFSQYLFNCKTENNGVLDEIERAFKNVDTDRILTVNDLESDFEELREIDTQWKGYSFDEFIAWLLEIGTIVEL